MYVTPGLRCRVADTVVAVDRRSRVSGCKCRHSRRRRARRGTRRRRRRRRRPDEIDAAVGRRARRSFVGAGRRELSTGVTHCGSAAGRFERRRARATSTVAHGEALLSSELDRQRELRRRDRLRRVSSVGFARRVASSTSYDAERERRRPAPSTSASASSRRSSNVSARRRRRHRAASGTDDDRAIRRPRRRPAYARPRRSAAARGAAIAAGDRVVDERRRVARRRAACRAARRRRAPASSAAATAIGRRQIAPASSSCVGRRRRRRLGACDQRVDLDAIDRRRRRSVAIASPAR